MVPFSRGYRGGGRHLPDFGPIWSKAVQKLTQYLILWKGLLYVWPNGGRGLWLEARSQACGALGINQRNSNQPMLNLYQKQNHMKVLNPPGRQGVRHQASVTAKMPFLSVWLTKKRREEIHETLAGRPLFVPPGMPGTPGRCPKDFLN